MVGDYRAYLSRFDAEVGALAVGAYGKWQGQLVRKLSEAEFATRSAEFDQLDRTYRGILERGDTIDDTLVRVWRERRCELLIPETAPER